MSHVEAVAMSACRCEEKGVDALRLMKELRFMTVALSFALGWGCVTQPKLIGLSVEELIREEANIDQNLSLQLAQEFSFKKESDVTGYLAVLSLNLVQKNPELRMGKSLDFRIIQKRQEKWINLNFPKNHIYLSLELMKTLEFENELAALVALHLAQLSRKHFFERLKNELWWGQITSDRLSHLKLFGQRGLFEPSSDTDQLAIPLAVRILYRAGFDPRGMISLFHRYEEAPLHSPYPTDELRRSIDLARRELSLYAPLRNPIIRSQNFLLIQKKIRDLCPPSER